MASQLQLPPPWTEELDWSKRILPADVLEDAEAVAGERLRGVALLLRTVDGRTRASGEQVRSEDGAEGLECVAWWWFFRLAADGRIAPSGLTTS